MFTFPVRRFEIIWLLPQQDAPNTIVLTFNIIYKTTYIYITLLNSYDPLQQQVRKIE